MKWFLRRPQKSKVTTLVQQGLANSEIVTAQQIRDCIYLLGSSLGDTWKAASKEVAAGMALLALARDAQLPQYLNRNGWMLVMSFITANPGMASSLSLRTIGEIISYRQAQAAVPA